MDAFSFEEVFSTSGGSIAANGFGGEWTDENGME
jgi:hypothetical protein